jgi:hypothetical protein
VVNEKSLKNPKLKMGKLNLLKLFPGMQGRRG